MEITIKEMGDPVEVVEKKLPIREVVALSKSPIKDRHTKVTTRQRNALKYMAKGGTAASAMRKAGYSKNSIKNPQHLTQSDGFLALMNKLGLTDDLLGKSLVDDIKENPGPQRKGMLELGFKVRGHLGPDVQLQNFSPIQVLVQRNGTETDNSND